MSKKSALYVTFDVNVAYSEQAQCSLAEIFDFQHPPTTGSALRDNLASLADVEVIFSSWGGPLMDAAFLAAAPRLEAVFYAAGTIRGLVTEEFWKRSIPICSAWAANAIPVAEFTFAQITLALKQVHQLSREMYRLRRNPQHPSQAGAYHARVGVIGLGMIGRLVVERLRGLHVEVWACDPTLTPEMGGQLGVKMADLDTLFRTCQVISLHAPDLESTRGMITGAHLRLMSPGSTFINTARGAVVRESEMIEALQARPDIFAILDVTHPEPPVPDSPLYEMPNVYLTPHIAGSVGTECWRMGDYMLDEARRYLAGESLRWQVTHKMFQNMA